jgi:hypothetical protein
MDGFPGFRVGGAFAPENLARLRARQGDDTGYGEGKKRFSVHGQVVLFSEPKDGEKNRPRKQFDAFCVFNYAIFRSALLECAYFCKKGVGFLYDFKIIYESPPGT